MKRYLLIHYSEIGLKKSNKRYFVDKLRKQIKEKLEKRFRETFSVYEVLSRLMVPLESGFVEEDYVQVIKKIFAIKNFQFVYEGSIDLRDLGEAIWENMPDDIPGSGGTFRVTVKRSQLLDYSSIEAAKEIGAFLLRSGIDIGVKMKNTDFVFNVEFFNNFGYFSYKKYLGAGGLSANSGAKLICMISSGFDSPVAAYRMMRRGARVIFVHFHAYPFTDQSEMDHVKNLVEVLSDYQFDTKLYLFPFGKVQKSIATNLDIPAKVRVVLYRRMMLRIAERISKKEKAKGVITGDSYGQVASQTPQNLFAVHEAGSIPLFQPLIAFDKDEIIDISKVIGTHDISKLPCKDTCSMFNPKHPELTASPYDLREYEKLFQVEEFVEEVLKEGEIVTFS